MVFFLLMIHVDRFLKCCIFDQYLIWLLNRKKRKKKSYLNTEKKNLETFLSN